MKITLAGTPGSGKSTIRKLIAEHYQMEVKATGDFMREAAKRHGFSDITKFLVEYVSTHPEVDREVDAEQKRFGENHDHFVLDATSVFTLSRILLKSASPAVSKKLEGGFSRQNDRQKMPPPLRKQSSPVAKDERPCGQISLNCIRSILTTLNSLIWFWIPRI